MNRTLSKVRDALRQPWMLALLLAACIPAFPEYMAPFFAIGSLTAAGYDARLHHRMVVLGPIGKLLLLYIGYMCFGMLYTRTPLESAGTILMWCAMFAAYLSLSTILADRSRLDTALTVFAAVASGIGVIGCLQYLLYKAGLPVSLQVWEWLDRVVYDILPLNVNIGVEGVRVSATFSNPNILGQYMVMTTPFLAYCAFHGGTRRLQLLCRFGLLAVIGCVAFSFSRGAYLALLMIALVFAIANIRRILSIALCAVSALVLVPDTVLARLISVRGLDASIVERLDVWEISFGVIAQNPLFGTGPGVQHLWDVLVANGINAPHAHNLLFQLLVEGGLIGVILMLMIGWRLAQNTIELVVRRRDRAIGVVFVAFAVGFCTNALVEYAFLSPKLIGMFLMALALSDCVCRQRLAHPACALAETLPFRLTRRKARNVAYTRTK